MYFLHLKHEGFDLSKYIILLILEKTLKYNYNAEKGGHS